MSYYGSVLQHDEKACVTPMTVLNPTNTTIETQDQKVPRLNFLR
jgi:hypothetical protein